MLAHPNLLTLGRHLISPRTQPNSDRIAGG